MQLKNKQMQIPGGYQFVQPEINWSAPRFASFQTIVTGLKSVRLANPFLAQKHGWRTDDEGVAHDVEQYNVRVCLNMGWNAFLIGGGAAEPPPKTKPPSSQESSQVAAAGAKSAKIWSGVKTLNSWLDSGEPPVPAEQSAARAAVCAKCPKNGKGDFTAWFTQPASEAIRRQMEKLAERKLTTPSDEYLNVCEVCLCPLKLKVHTPLSHIRTHMKPATEADLRAVEPPCWIPTEIG